MRRAKPDVGAMEQSILNTIENLNLQLESCNATLAKYDVEKVRIMAALGAHEGFLDMIRRDKEQKPKRAPRQTKRRKTDETPIPT